MTDQLNANSVIDKSNRFKVFFLAGFLYLLFVAGGLIPVSVDEYQKSMGKALALLIVLFLLCKSKITIKRHDAPVILIFFTTASFICFVGIVNSDHMVYAFEKFDGAIFSTIAITLLIRSMMNRGFEIQLYKYFLYCCLIILLITVVYKLYFGFFDRAVNFFLNGPIVYGWIMGFSAILSFHVFKLERSRFFLFIIVFFIASLLWTQSKGPMIAFAGAFFLYIWLSSAWRFRFLILTVLFGAVILVSTFSAEIAEIDSSRLLAVVRIFQEDSADTDEGSIGIRWTLLDEAFKNFVSSPWIGIGLGNFVLDEHNYPHNQHVEVLSELGIIAAFLHIAFLVAAMMKANKLNRVLIIFFIIGSSFSGNISYFRFIYPFALLSFMSKNSLHKGDVREILGKSADISMNS